MTQRPVKSVPVTLVLILGMAALGALCTGVPALADALIYRRDAVLSGQAWRLVTAMWVHLSWTHWLANSMAMAGLVLLGTAAALPVRQLVGTVLICGVAVTAALLRVPEVAWYAGLSGALHGVALWLGIVLATRAGEPTIAQHWRWLGVLMCGGVLVKLWLEHSWLSPLVHDPDWGFGVARIAHALGAISGAVWWCVGQWRMRRRPTAATRR